METTVSEIVKVDIPWALRRVERTMIFIVCVVDVVGHYPQVVRRYEEKEVVASHQ